MAKVVALGIYIVDVLGLPVTEIPPGQGLALLQQIRFTVAGTAGGAAVDMAKLGLDVVAMGCIGRDEAGGFMLEVLERYKVDTTYLRRKQTAQTSATMLPIRPNGERPALHVIGANGELTYEDVDLEAVASADFLLFGGTPLMPKFDGESAALVLKSARSAGAITLYDLLGIPTPDLREKVYRCLPHLDFFMPNYEEAQMLTGLEDRRDILRCLLDQGASHVVLKAGAKGSCIGYYEHGVLQEVRAPSFAVPVVDSTGCGDAWNAGFIKGLSLGWNLATASRLGCACGALVIQGLGSDAGIINFAETIKFADSSARYELE